MNEGIRALTQHFKTMLR